MPLDFSKIATTPTADSLIHPREIFSASTTGCTWSRRMPTGLGRS